MDDKTGLLNIQTQGFSPEFALKFNQTVLKESERFINEMSHRIARDQLAFAESEMEKARQRLDASKAELLSYQDSNNVLESTSPGSGGEHVSKYADGSEDPDGSRSA